MADRSDAVMWTGGGGWDDVPASPPEPPSPPDGGATPGARRGAAWGPSERRGARGLVPGRFLPLHRGHQFVLDTARASVEQLSILVFETIADPVPGATRARWIRELYPDADVQVAAYRPDDLVAHVSGERPTHVFGSELDYRALADALGATFVPVDPARATIPISGTAIRANVMETFGYLAPPARPWFVRRVAVVGAESSGKSTLCARLHAELRTPVVAEWTRVLAEAGPGTLRAEDVQLAARTQIATEDALARQAPPDGAVLVCDTELRTLWLWARRLYGAEPPAWIRKQIDSRPYDLYLLCAPDLPFVGAPDRDHPAERRAHHDALVRELAGLPVVELRGSRDERFRTAADAIIALYTPRSLLSARGARMR